MSLPGTFYVTLLGALTALLALAGKDKQVVSLNGGTLICAAGVVLSVLWFLHMGSFRALFKAKFAVLEEMETNWTVKPFTRETARLSKTTFMHVTTIDQGVAGVLAVAFVLLPMLGWWRQPPG